MQAALAEAKAAGEAAQETVAAVTAELTAAHAGAETQREYVQQLEGVLCIQPQPSCFGQCRRVQSACVPAAGFAGAGAAASTSQFLFG